MWWAIITVGEVFYRKPFSPIRNSIKVTTHQVLGYCFLQNDFKYTLPREDVLFRRIRNEKSSIVFVKMLKRIEIYCRGTETTWADNIYYYRLRGTNCLLRCGRRACTPAGVIMYELVSLVTVRLMRLLFSSEGGVDPPRAAEKPVCASCTKATTGPDFRCVRRRLWDDRVTSYFTLYATGNNDL